MPASRIAITLPPDLLQCVDRWTHKLDISRSRFIAEQIAHRLRELEDAEVTRLYDEAYQEEPCRTQNSQLAEEMLQLTPPAEEEVW
jgi:metal-responsive CopG/Arc/MetJ family transcriptional regulator